MASASTSIPRAVRTDEESKLEMNEKDKESSAPPSVRSEILTVEGEQQVSQPLVDEYPEGGLKAWLNVVGGICTTCATFGLINAWGVFQSLYEDKRLVGTPSSSIAWIGGLQYMLVFFPGLFMGRLLDLGYDRLPFFIWSCVLVASCFIIAECTKFWHYILVQGVIVGLACGCLFQPAVAILTHWFKKRLSFAFGIAAIGSSIGGTVCPIMIRELERRIGFAWSLRVMGFIEIVLLTVANLTVRRRLPPMNVKGGLFNLAAFKSPAYALYVLSSFFCFFGLYTVLTFMDVAAISHGVSPDKSFYLVSIANGFSGLGRFFAGITGTRIGALNTLIPCTTLAAVMTIVWPFVKTFEATVVVAAFYGLAQGAYVSLLIVPAAHLGAPGDVGRRTGMMGTVMAFGALGGPPTAGAIATAAKSFVPLGGFSGAMVIIAVLCMIAVKRIVTGHWIRGKF